MKATLTFILITITFQDPIFSQIVNIPDWPFKNILIGLGVDKNHDYEISVDEAANVKYLDLRVTCMDCAQINDLTGIDAFINLEHLDISKCRVDSFFVKNSKLKSLFCYGCYNLKYLNVSNCNELDTLNFGGCKIDTIDLSNNFKLTHLDCKGDYLNKISLPKLISLKYLDFSGNDVNLINLKDYASVESLILYGCQISEYDFNTFNRLKYLNCEFNNLKKLNISQCTLLENINCFGNNIDSLDLSNKIFLKNLDCGQNEMVSLNIDNDSNLVDLEVYNGKLTKINLNDNKKLENLDLYNNLICYLDLSRNKSLQFIRIDSNVKRICVSQLPISFKIQENVDTSKIEFEICPLKISDISENNNIEVYPNPCKTELNIIFNTFTNQEKKIQLFNLLGQSYYNKSISGNFVSIKMHNIQRGVYFICIYDNSGILYERKILKQ